MADKFARLAHEYKYKNETVFPAIFENQDEDDQVLDDIEL